jgi:hypothetical protein
MGPEYLPMPYDVRIGYGTHAPARYPEVALAEHGLGVRVPVRDAEGGRDGPPLRRVLVVAVEIDMVNHVDDPSEP